MEVSDEDLLPFITYRTSRSGGSGGQHVNKVSTKVELLFDLFRADVFSEEDKLVISKKLQSKFSSNQEIQIFSQESRSQLKNKEAALRKLTFLLKQALREQKPRKPTKPSKKSIEKRLIAKRKNALKKIDRNKFSD